MSASPPKVFGAGAPATEEAEASVPLYPPNPVVMAEARRLASEDLDRGLGQVAELLAQQGHHGPDGRPYPGRTVANLLDEGLRRRRADRWHERNRGAAEDFNQWLGGDGRHLLAGDRDSGADREPPS